MIETKTIILASGSPRRHEIMRNAGFHFKVAKADVKENFPDNMPVTEVPVYLAKKKASYFKGQSEEEIIIGCDTIVSIGDKILGKPKDLTEATKFLKQLSNKSHEVISGVCIIHKQKEISFYDITTVHFRKLNDDEIKYYVERHEPFDKAGAYGVQEFIGMIGIDRIEGSYYNVMGLPIHKVYAALKEIS